MVLRVCGGLLVVSGLVLVASGFFPWGRRTGEVGGWLFGACLVAVGLAMLALHRRPGRNHAARP